MRTSKEQVMENQKITKKDLMKVFWRSIPFEISWNYVRQMHSGVAYALGPIIEKLYKTKEERAEALKRHMEFFNITPYFATLVLGIVTAMEEKNAEDPEFDVASINNVKASIMGPLSGIGDSLFLNTWRIITAGIGISLAMNGSPLGAVIFLILYNIPALILRYFGMMKGYELGTGLIEKVQKLGLMSKIMDMTGILGLMTVGSMIATMVTMKTGITFGSGEAVTELQAILDTIMPCLLAACATFLIYWLLGKNIKTTWLLIAIIIASIICARFGILAV